ncbi:MAG: hypothetical protein AAF674_12415 [Pseudomonadota bacterium]
MGEDKKNELDDKDLDDVQGGVTFRDWNLSAGANKSFTSSTRKGTGFSMPDSASMEGEDMPQMRRPNNMGGTVAKSTFGPKGRGGK